MEENQSLKKTDNKAALPTPPAHWKSAFAAEVARKAKQLALESDSLGLVTLEHFRKAARIAVDEQFSTLQNDNNPNQQFRA